jgi:hypothetical protein
MTLRSLPLDSLPVVGALDQELTAAGVTWRRLPAWTRPQLVDPGLQLVVQMPAGVRLELRTTSTVLELDVAMTAVRVGDLPFNPPTFDLVVDGELRGSVPTDDHTTLQVVGPQEFEVVPGGPATVRFELPGDLDRVVEVWLPHSATVEVLGVRVDEHATVEPVARTRRRWVHHGSSISHCLEAPSPTGTWPAIAARLADVDLVSLGLGGQCMLDQHVARTIRDLPADLISLKAGINVVNGDTMRERTFRAALHGFLDTVRDGHPETPFVVATPIVCPTAEDHPGPTVLMPDGRFHVVARPEALAVGALSLQRIREIMTEIVTTRQEQGDTALHLVDGLQLLGPDDAALLPDGLHPSAEGYRLIAERFHKLVFEGSFAR